ncbi:Replicative DNA helicase [[Eubacterium] contortum]|uniref:Replicative DNA helicase n=1 Tax=Faecalicatena contorta TaxID=39482 RepID=A0A174JL94_9FIRM|nr:AAA family ATPase [Faecalicatena contorta]CUO98617.1 Replicative DNA helicase [[Eubacterium] contortum] [Faecalicatena contorta]
MLNEKEVRKAIALMKPDNQLFEVRVIYGNKQLYSGYFQNAEALVRGFDKLRNFGDCNIYITLNTLNDACYDRTQRDRFEKNPKATTSDNDVTGYDWMMLDLDPIRPTGTSSTDEQIKKAKAKGNQIYKFLKNLGFNDPLFGFSGNGVHLLYRVYLDKSEEVTALMKKSLKTLDMLFTDAEIGVDMKNFNPARVCKLYGTLAQKGANTDVRPHRMSYIIGSPENIEVNDIKYLQKLCNLYPKEEKPQRYNNYQPREFDLEEWLSKYGFRYRKSSYSDGTKYILDCCPFDSNHKGKDACIFQSRSGAIGFHCFHNSCSDKTWRDVRLLYEPDAYEKRQLEYEHRIYQKPNRFQDIKKIEIVEGRPIFYTAKDILDLPVTDEAFIKTGIMDIDKKMRGLKKGYVSVISGLRASGKSSVISEICLDCVETGNNAGVFSGELSPKNFMRWMNLQAAGKGYTEPTQFEGYYNVQKKYQKYIADWLGEHFFLYNNEYGNDYLAVIEQFEKQVEEKKLDLLILDNLMAFNISTLSDNKYDAQTLFVLGLEQLAKRKDIHIAFVAHPRKAMGFLRLDDISGTGDLGNAVDNAFIVHRVNEDFRRLTKQMFGWKDDNELYRATNVIEIAKDRDGGIQDHFTPLFYEKESKRLKNYVAENKLYGWNKHDDGFVPVAEDMELVFE